MVKSDTPAGSVGILTIVLTLAGWSSVPLFLRYFRDDIDVWTANGWRYGISALFWAPVVLLAYSRNRLPVRIWRAALIPSIINAIGQVTFASAHYMIEPGLLTFGLRTQLIFAAVGAYFIFPGERRIIGSRSFLIGMVVLLTGTSAAILLGDAGLSSGSESAEQGSYVVGAILSVLSGFFFAAYGISVRKYMHGINSIVAFGVISQYTALVMVLLMIGLADQRGVVALHHGTGFFALLVVSGLIGIALGHVLYYISLAQLGVAVSAGVLQLQPFIVAIFSFFLFKETLNGLQWTGGIIALAGAVLMLSVQQRISRRKHIDTSALAIAEGEGGA